VKSSEIQGNSVKKPALAASGGLVALLKLTRAHIFYWHVFTCITPGSGSSGALLSDMPPLPHRANERADEVMR